jgi:hypothetical protein
MPQQWERELQRVSSLRAPTSTRARIEGGPRGDGMPPSPGRGQRVLAGAVALALFAGALVFAVNAFSGRPSAPPASAGEAVTFTFSVVVPDPDANGYPHATMQVGDRTIAANAGPYTWNGAHAEPPKSEITSLNHWVDVPAGAPIVIEGTADQVRGWVDSCCDQSYPPPHLSEFDLEHGAHLPEQGPTPAESAYVLEFDATWSQGSGTFLFPIRVVTAPEPSPSAGLEADDFTFVATMSTPADGSAPGLALGYGGIKKSYPGAGHWAGAPVYVVGMLFTFDRALPTGASLQVAGDADRFEAHISKARVDGGWADPDALDVSSGRAILPSDPGGYLLELQGWWPRGRMGYSVAITIGHAPEPSVSPLPSVEEGVVPEVVGLGVGDAEKLLSQAGYETSVRYAPISGFAAGIVDSVVPGPGTRAPAGYRVALHVSGTDVPLDGYLTPLACSSQDMMPFAGSHLDAFADPEGIIRRFIDGIRSTDKVAQTRFDQGVQPIGLWEIERASDVIAVVHLPSLEGIACRGSGIGGV